MPSSRVGMPADSWVSSVRRGIIPESALCALCRIRHNAHWTKHPGRLAREFGRKAWGDEGYAREELVAELASAFLCADLELTPVVREDHAEYIATLCGPLHKVAYVTDVLMWPSGPQAAVCAMIVIRSTT